MSRKSELRRINRKAGWRDGHSGEEKNIPTRLISTRKKSSYGFVHVPVPFDEEDAYHRGYEEGRNAPADAVNPYI